MSVESTKDRNTEQQGVSFEGIRYERGKQDTSKGLRHAETELWRLNVETLKGGMITAEIFASARLRALEMNCINMKMSVTVKQNIGKSGNGHKYLQLYFISVTREMKQTVELRDLTQNH